MQSTSATGRELVHEWRVPDREYQRHQARRGRRWAYPEIDPYRTALIVVDMVPFHTDANPHARGIVPHIQYLATCVRSAGGTVAWVLPAPTPNRAAAEEFHGTEIAARYQGSGGTGPLEQRLSRGLTTMPGDLLTEKTAHSAFFPGRCPLPDLLDERGVTTVVITGTATDVCCESSARDAFTLGYRVLFAADATATGDDPTHNASLRTVYHSFGDVRATADLAMMLTPAADR